MQRNATEKSPPRNPSRDKTTCETQNETSAPQRCRNSGKTTGETGHRPLMAAAAGVSDDQCGDNDERESLVNDRRRGTKYEITPKVDEVTAIHGFMIDLDCKMLDPAVVGDECVESADALYHQHVRLWLDRDLVLAKAEVRDTGGGLHVILWLDEPLLVTAGEARDWDAITRGIRNALPGDPNLNGIIALTRPVGTTNTKYDPPREVRLLRSAELVTRADILGLIERMAAQSARLWMRLFFGDERVTPCPLCGQESLGVAGSWQVRCYGCGRIDAAALVYRFYSPEFLKNRREVEHG